ncbi:MAG: helix-turn-helix transcriptional regulator [Erysipelotrichaceae bacterium]|nr:helix-turn-helix transcriptional regulator [Erysipelotrichaceae bacterium]
MAKIGKNIKRLRISNEMSQDNLAEKLFVSRQTISNYETGKTTPDIEMIIRIGEIFNTDVNELIYGPPVVEDKKRERIFLLFQAGICLLTIGVAYSLDLAATDLAMKFFIVGPLLLIDSLMWPAVFIFAGFTIMKIFYTLIGGKKIRWTHIRKTRHLIILALIIYSIILLPFWLDLFKATFTFLMSYISSRDFGPYGSSLDLGATWNRIAQRLLLFASSYSPLFSIVGGGLMLTGNNTKEHKNIALTTYKK